MTADEPTRNEVAYYRTGTRRTELLTEVHEWLTALPTGDLDTAERALSHVRGLVVNRDLRYAAGRFYVLGPDALWTVDDEASSRTGQLLHTWAAAECKTVDTFDRELRAAHRAAEQDDDENFGDRYDKVRGRFNKQSAAWARRVQSGPVRERVLSDLRMLDGVFLDSPELFDANPDVLAVANGVIDLRTATLRPLRAEDHITQRVDVTYDPAAEAPLWTRFLRDILVTEDGQPDTELIAWMARLIGYGITGHASAQVFATFHGQGANGKSVLIETLGDLFEAISRTTAMSTLEVKSNGSAASGDLARLHGARLVFASEGEVGSRISAATVKRITGEDRITARFLYRPEFEFKPRFLLIMASNTRAKVLDTSEGYWRRLRAVPFRRVLAPHERDETLHGRLRGEHPGILRWAVEGAREWYSFGLGATAATTEAGAAYRDEMDPLAEWLGSHAEVTGEHGDRVQAKDAWESYLEWADDAHATEDAIGRKAFLAMLGERKGIARKRLTAGWFYFGLRVLDVPERKRREHLGEPAAVKIL